MKQLQGTPPLHQWFLQNAKNKTCGVDPRLLTISQAQQWQKVLKSVNGKLVPIDENLIDEIWQDRPSPPSYPIQQYPLENR